jgi:putative spermidine/putrescine transport system permease protein
MAHRGDTSTGGAVRRARAALAPYALALPAFVMVAVFVYGALNGVLQGFGIMPFLGMTEPTLDYFKAAFSRSDFLGSLAFSLRCSAIAASIALAGGILLSWALTHARMSRFTQLVGLQVPIMTMHALVALAAVFVFSGSGLAARALYWLGVADAPTAFGSIVGAPSGWGIVLVYAWKEVPFVAFCTVTIMAHVSDSLGEAAATCGANSWRTFTDIVLPLCLPAALRAFLVVFVFSLGSYEVPFLLGPTSPKALPVLAYIEFTNPDIAHRCYAMAINGVTTLVCSVAAAVYFALIVRERNGEVRHG